MGVRHRELPIEGVQFHPESILTREGKRLLANFLARCAAASGGMSLVRAIALAVARRGVPAACSRRRSARSQRARRSPVQIAALLVALRTKGETVGEIAAAARALRGTRRRRRCADPRTVDTCGTGGDGAEHLQHLDRPRPSWSPAPACRSRSTATAPRRAGRQRRRARGARRARAICRSRAPREILREVGIGLPLRAARASGDAPRRAGARGARHPHADELPRPAARTRAACGASWSASTRASWSSRSRTRSRELGSERALVVHGERRPRRDHHHRRDHRGAARRRSRARCCASTPAALGIARADAAAAARAATPRRTRASRAACSRGEPGPRRDIVLRERRRRALGRRTRRPTWPAGVALARQSVDSRRRAAKLAALAAATQAARA